MKTKENKVKNNKIKIEDIREKGVTLIALVVTVVVLLILAGVTIVVIFNDDGIFGIAKEASLKTKIGELEDKSGIIYTNLLAKKYQANSNEEITTGDIVKELKNEGYNIAEVELAEDAISGISIEKTNISIAPTERKEIAVNFKENKNSKAYYAVIEEKNYKMELKNGGFKVEKEATVIEGKPITDKLTATSNNNNVEVKVENEKENKITIIASETKGTSIITIKYGKYEIECNVTVGLEWDFSKVKAVISNDEQSITVPVPIGFTASKVEAESKVKTGFVIYQGTEEVNDSNLKTAQTTRNQFVWVPIEDVTEMFGTDKEGNTLGKLYNFGNSKAPKNPPEALGWTETIDDNGKKVMTGSREPNIIISSTDGNGITYDGDEIESNYINAQIKDEKGNLITNGEDFKKQLQKEINELRRSIETYGGFYIGRYETGNWHGTDNAVVIKNCSDISATNSGVNADLQGTWYAFYQKSKSIVTENSIKSSMIWGCQWDATLKWLMTSGSKTISEINYSQNWGNFTGKKKNSGSNETYKANQIYDMPGNVWDFTIESVSGTNRVGRRICIS